MNILPKKRWHVRTKENIARVRRDEAEAAEKQRQEQLRIDNADREARLNVLKYKTKEKLKESGVVEVPQIEKPIQEHVNLFADLDHTIKITNKDHDKEVKQKQEEYEKKIGYLTYLGQDTNEALKKKNWYEILPQESNFSRSSEVKDTYEKLVLKDEDGKPKAKELDEKNGEICWKRKQELDPINAFKKYCFGEKKVTSRPKVNIEPTVNYKDKYEIKKNNKKDNVDKKEKLQKLREARVKREQQEKLRTEMFLKGLHGENKNSNKEYNVQKIKPKYNSQFNPELARQNYK